MIKLLLNLKTVLGLGLCLLIVVISGSVSAQERERVVDKTPKPTPQLPKSPNVRPQGLTNKIKIVGKNKNPQKNNKSLVKKTASSRAVNDDNRELRNPSYSVVTRAMMMQSIRSKLGIRYRYGTQGPRRYDCSGFVWKVFQESGIPFVRTSAREFWRRFEPVYGKDRFEFGTLVFLNRLGHVGIVADKNGFYHASSSKGVTYSRFKGYWSKRIVGFRRVPQRQY